MQNTTCPDGSDMELIANSGNLYRVDHDLTITKLVSDIGISNSLCFSPDGKTLYYADSPRNMIWQYDYDTTTGTPTNQRNYVSYPAGVPDGSTADAEGYLWNARYDGSCIIRFDPEGKPNIQVNLPTSQITCCTFGGKNLDTLFITTRSNQLANEEHCGGLFVVKLPLTGNPDVRFGG